MTPSARPAEPPTPAGPVWARWLVVAYLLVQIGVPLVQLAEPRPARFGWQMYSAMRAFDVFVVDPEGRRSPVSLDLLDAVREDLDPLDRLAPQLCPGLRVSRVVVVDRVTGKESSRECRGGTRR